MSGIDPTNEGGQALRWPTDVDTLVTLQRSIATLHGVQFRPYPGFVAAGCFVCFARGRGGSAAVEERAWAAVAVVADGRVERVSVIEGFAAAPYEPGLLAAREGHLLEEAVRGLSEPPDVLMVNATGLDHPRRAGLAVQLGWALDLPSVGITHRPLMASGSWPAPDAGARAPLRFRDAQVGWWLRTRAGARPVAVSPGWRTGLDTAADVVVATVRRARTPDPLRHARRLARSARSAAERVTCSVSRSDQGLSS